MLKISPVLEEYIEDYLDTRHLYLDLLRRVKDKIDDEVASVKDVQPYEHEVFRRAGIITNRDYFFAFHKKLFIDAAETKAKLKFITELIDRRTRELGLDNAEVWKHISERF